MRTIAELPHPDCKITIFSMNGKFLVKLERGAYEQTYKLSEADVSAGVDSVFQILDEDFLSAAVKRFKEMHEDFDAAYQRH